MKKFYKMIGAASILFFVMMIFSCSKNENDVAPFNIVATNFPCYDFARAVVGSNSDFELCLLIKPGMEVHSFDPTPADIIAIQNADLFIYIGGESDEWVRRILSSSKKQPRCILKMMDFVDLLDEEIALGMEEDGGNRKNDIHKASNDKKIEEDEHIWTSSENAKKMVMAIADAISKIIQTSDDEQNIDLKTINENAQNYCQQITKISKQIDDVVMANKNASGKNETFIIVGDRFPLRYFAQEHGISYAAAFAGCSTAVEAKTSTIANLIDMAKEKNVKVIYSIELSNQKLAKAIAKECDAQVLELHSAHNVTKADFESGLTYVQIMQRNLQALR